MALQRQTDSITLADDDDPLLQSLFEQHDHTQEVILEEIVQPYQRESDPLVQRQKSRPRYQSDTDTETRYVPLDAKWDRTHRPNLAPNEVQQQQGGAAQVEQATAYGTAPAPTAPARKSARPKTTPAPKPIVTKVQAQPITMVEADTPALPQDEDAYDDIRVHDRISRVVTTLLAVFGMFVAVRVLWLFGARYTIEAFNASAIQLAHVDAQTILRWNFQPFWLFNLIGKILTAIPLIGGLFAGLLKLPMVWMIPITFTLVESFFFPRRKGVWRSMKYFWKPLNGERRWKHWAFLFVLALDVGSTCVGAIMDQVVPNTQTTMALVNQTFRWSVLKEATPQQLMLGIFIGIVCGIGAERVFAYSFREIIGLWFPPTSWIHRLFQPVSYVQY